MVFDFKSQLSNSEEKTQEIAASYAAYILKKKPTHTAVVLGLQGDLGAGKTTFLQGFAKALGVTEKVNSPTFVIMKRFPLKGNTFKNFYHFDCYRIENPEEILSLGFKDIVNNPENIVAIEWPEKIKEVLPKEMVHIGFKDLKKGKRELVWIKE